MVGPKVSSVTSSQIGKFWAHHRLKNQLQHSGGVDHFSAASVTYDVWEGPGGPTAAGSAWMKTTIVFLQRSVVLSHLYSSSSRRGLSKQYFHLRHRTMAAKAPCSEIWRIWFLLTDPGEPQTRVPNLFFYIFFSKPRAPLKGSSVEITNENLAGAEAPIYHPSYECYTSF